MAAILFNGNILKTELSNGTHCVLGGCFICSKSTSNFLSNLFKNKFVEWTNSVKVGTSLLG